MKILVINPNTTMSMTEKIGIGARENASEGTEIIATNPTRGPVSIEGYYDEAMCLVGMMEEIRRHPDVDAIVIACFDDTGLDATRMLTNVPVIGMGEAAYAVANLISNKFSVVTTLSRSVPALEHNLAKYGYDRKCIRVRASDIPVLDLENEESGAADRIRSEIILSIKEDRAEAVVLGCAGMGRFVEGLEKEFRIPMLDGVKCGIALAESMIRLGLKTTKVGGYASPPPEKIIDV